MLFRSTHDRKVDLIESRVGPYGQVVTVGRHVFVADEPAELGGRDSGPAPYELVLAGLGACTAMTLRMYASRHGWPVEKIGVELQHDKTADGGDRFERVITLTGPLSDEQRSRLLDIAEKCPVSRTLKRGSTVSSRLA